MTNQTPESVIAEVIEYHADTIGSHWDGCYKHHAGCLAVKLRDMLREPGVPDAATEDDESTGSNYLEEKLALRSVVVHLVPGDWDDDEIGILVEGLLATRWGKRLAYSPSDTSDIHADARMIVGSVLGGGPRHGRVIDIVKALDDDGLLCLRAERDAATAAIERVTAERDAAMARIAKAWELHEPFIWSFGHGPVQSCKWCADHGAPQEVASWPCPTIQALEDVSNDQNLINPHNHAEVW